MSLLEEKKPEPEDGKERMLSRSLSHDSAENVSLEALSGRLRTLSTMSVGQESPCLSEPIVEKDDEEVDGKIEEEQFKQGSINAKTYKEYLKAGSSWFLIIITIVATILSQGMFNGSDLFLTYW